MAKSKAKKGMNLHKFLASGGKISNFKGKK